VAVWQSGIARVDGTSRDRQICVPSAAGALIRIQPD
jgi:hypothetical protein